MSAPTAEESRALLERLKSIPPSWCSPSIIHLRAALDREAAALEGWQHTSTMLGAALTRAERAERERDEASLQAKNSHDAMKERRSQVYEMRAERDAARVEAERLREALERIVQWADAYPLDIFPEPDFRKAQEVLRDAGMTLDSISASNMRHVVEGVGNIVRAALTQEPGQ